jgi:hypothetical protein
LMVNVAEVAPAGIVILAGTTTPTLFVVRVTTAPPGPAALVKVAVPVSELPPTTEDGVRVMEERVAALTVRLADLVVIPSLAVTVPLVFELTGTVVTVNVAVVAPAATVTLGGTVAAGFVVDNVKARPPAGAAAAKVIVPVEDAPPVTEVGFSAMEANSGFTVRFAERVVPR